MMDLFFRVFKHLLPRSKAWSIIIDKLLRNFFEGLTGLPSDFKDFIDEIWLDIFPATTRQVAEWETQFGIVSPANSEADRRDTLAASWTMGGGQGPDTIQDIIQAAGFPLFVHEPWYFTPGKTLRNPNTYLIDGDTTIVYVTECGEALAECGEASAVCGDTSTPTGILLVNKILIRGLDYVDAVMCGDVGAECGEVDAECGNNTGFDSEFKKYTIPGDPTLWAYFFYIGGETFGDSVSISADRKSELETLLLKICPAHVWLGLLVTYSE